MSTTQPPDAANATATQQAQREHAISAEYLKLTPDAYLLLTGKHFAGNLSFPWGNPAMFYGQTPASLTVSDLLMRLGLSMEDLIALLKTSTLNPNIAALLRVQALGLDYATITGWVASGF